MRRLLFVTLLSLLFFACGPASHAGSQASLSEIKSQLNCASFNGKTTTILKNVATTLSNFLVSRALQSSGAGPVQQAAFAFRNQAQSFRMLMQENCAAQIQSVQESNLCLDSGNGNDAQLTLKPCGESDSQIWHLQQNADAGTPLPNFSLRTNDQRCVQVDGNSTANGANYVMHSCDGQFDQQFYLPDLISTGPAQEGNWQPNTYVANSGQHLPYQFLLPIAYDPSKSYPLLIYLHGIGQRGTDNKSQMVNGAEIFNYPEIRAKFPAIVIVPQCPPDDIWGIGQSRPTRTAISTLELIQSIASKFSVNRKRIYLSGLSLGGQGTWDFAARWGGVFAAFLPMSGSTQARSNQFGKTPIWAIHGGADPVVSANFDINLTQAINAAKGSAKLTLIKAPDTGSGHGPWSPLLLNPGTLEWLFSQSQ